MELIDFHAHILPHMDHGSGRTATSQAQLSLMASAGTDTVCATSHFYPQSTLPGVFLSDRRESLTHLLETYGDAPRPRICLGAEVLICPGLENMEGLADLCVEGTNVLLLEMPFTSSSWDGALYQTIREIRALDLCVVLAHVDRYPKDLIEELLDDGLYGQINADSLDRFFKPKHLLRWMDEGRIVALGSDLHGCDPRAYEPYQKLPRTQSERVGRIMQSTAYLLRDAKHY